MARPIEFETIYLDSNVFLRTIMKEPGCEPVRELFELADKRKVAVYASPLIQVEVRGQPRGQTDPTIEHTVMAVLSGARIIDVEFSRPVALRARQYVGRYSLKPADAIHLASAVEAEVDVFWSWDRDFSQLAGSRIDGVWVDEPYEIGQPRLPGT